MIEILVGSDNKAKKLYIKNLAKDSEPVFLASSDSNRESILKYATGVSLFGETSVFVISDMLLDIPLKNGDLEMISGSKNTFIFLEDKLLADEQKIYKKYANILKFEETKIPKKDPVNTFAIADAFANKDKIKAWILYLDAIEKGIAPEAISGILFWKIKTMILNDSKIFPQNVLKDQSSRLVSLYHRSHRGELDFAIGLEQFILSSLSK
jgi:hypothetical protein